MRISLTSNARLSRVLPIITQAEPVQFLAGHDPKEG